MTRNTNSPSAQALAALDNTTVVVVQADLDDPPSLQATFRDTHAIFAVTGFWQFPNQASTHAFAGEKGVTWNEACYKLELQQGKNAIDAAAAVLAEPGAVLERLVISSLSDARKASRGRLGWVYHFDSKAHYVR